VSTTAIVYNAEVSPDGHWLAFESSNESGVDVYVRPFPDVDGGQWQVSTAGGVTPLWARNGRELFYVDPAGRIMSVSIAQGQRFSWGSPQVAVEKGFALRFGGFAGRTYDVSNDGRFLVFEDVATDAPPRRPRIVVVQNWFEELKRLSPN
jgi:serine/threonine-protein kinase